MKYIQVPEAVTLIEPQSKQPLKDPNGQDATISMYEYADVAWFSDRSLSDGGPVLLRKWSKILDAFEAAKEAKAKYIVLEDEHCKLLEEIVKKSKGAPGFYELPFGNRLEIQCLCFPEAVLEASSKKPSDLNPPKEVEAEPEAKPDGVATKVA